MEEGGGETEKMMAKKKMLIAGLAMTLMVGLVSGALISYFGRVIMTATVTQAVLLDGLGFDEMPISEEANVVGGESFCRPHWLQSQTSVPVELQFVTTFSPTLWDDEITVAYYKPLGYTWAGQTVYVIGTKPYQVYMTVVDGECEVTWTFDFPIEGDTGDGHMGVALVIATDGVGEGPAFQIHNNDGTDSSYGDGTWLVSPWGPTINDGWRGWHSSYLNTPVDELGWVSATGDRYKVTNPEGKFNITIDKCMLGDEFHWAVWTGVGGFYDISGHSAYPENFTWDQPIVGDPAGNYAKATIMEELTSPFTLMPMERLDFVICYSFDPLIAPGEYNITTTVKPA